MKLHGITRSPFVQRVLMAARIKGIDIELVPLPAGGMQTPEFAAISPTRRMPVLEDSDGWCIVESGPIISYLDETQPGPKLTPGDARTAAKARAIVSIVDVDVHAGLRIVGLQKVFGADPNEALLDYGRKQIEVGLDALEEMGVGSDIWAAGDAPSIADVAFVPTLAAGKIIAELSDDGDLMAGRPGIDAYWARVQANPISAQIHTTIREGFRQVLGLV